MEICTRIASGESLTRICRDETMPGLSAVYQWLLVHTEFAEMYARAREDQADTLADEIIDIADESQGGKVADVHSASLRVDARKWVAAKLKPRKYSERHFQEVTGKDGGPIESSHTFLTPMPIEDIEEWAREYAPPKK